MCFYFLSANKPFALHLSAIAAAVTIQEGLSRHEHETYTARLVLQNPSPETPLPELETTHVNTIISQDTDTSDHLPELLNPSSYPAPVPLEKIQAIPPAPALHHGLVRNRTRLGGDAGSFSSACHGSGSLRKQAASRVTLQSENVN